VQSISVRAPRGSLDVEPIGQDFGMAGFPERIGQLLAAQQATETQQDPLPPAMSRKDVRAPGRTSAASIVQASIRLLMPELYHAMQGVGALAPI
jgi:hypothetical protein